MTDLRTAAQQALEALAWASDLNSVAQQHAPLNAAITAIKTALEQPEQDTDCHAQGICQRSGFSIKQPEQEPVAWANSADIASSKVTRERGGQGDVHTWSETKSAYHDKPLYTHPPRREWRSLSEEEIHAALPHEPGDLDFVCARAIEAALRSKNHE